MFSYTMTVQLEYINHLLQIFPIIYAGIMLNAFSHQLCLKLCWHNWPVPTNITGLNHTLQQLITQLTLYMQAGKSQGKYPTHNCLHKLLVQNNIKTLIIGTEQHENNVICTGVVALEKCKQKRKQSFPPFSYRSTILHMIIAHCDDAYEINLCWCSSISITPGA